MLTVSTDEICAAIKDGFMDTHSNSRDEPRRAEIGHKDGSIDTQSTDPNSGCGPLPFAAPSLPLRHSPSHRRSILEPAGALAIAGVKQWAAAANTRDQTYVAITSGANMNFDSLRFVSERADASETLLSVVIPERPGET